MDNEQQGNMVPADYGKVIRGQAAYAGNAPADGEAMMQAIADTAKRLGIIPADMAEISVVQCLVLIGDIERLAGRAPVRQFAPGLNAIFRGKEYRVVALGDRPGTFDLHPLDYTSGDDSWRNVPASELAHVVEQAQQDARTAAQAVPGTMPAEFGEWFGKNYPGPDTIISDPAWHAPRIWRAAVHSMASTR